MTPVAAAHNAMRAEYDRIDDPWYAHLFNQIARFMLRLPPGDGSPALDVGCGTGLQTILLSRAGYRARGFDIADDLLEVARAKDRDRGTPDWGLYTSRIPEAMAEQRRLAAQFDQRRGCGPIWTPEFVHGDAVSPSAYEPGGYAVMVCCGSVLSFVDAHERVLELMAAALRPGGRLILEAEQRTNLDLLWPAVDLLLGGRLGYEQGLQKTARNLLAFPGENLCIEYPFTLADGRTVELPLWLFSVKYLERLFARAGFQPLARAGIHAVTNLLPSTLLHHPDLSPYLLRVVSVLGALDQALATSWPMWRLGCSVIYDLVRT